MLTEGPLKKHLPIPPSFVGQLKLELHPYHSYGYGYKVGDIFPRHSLSHKALLQYQ